MAAGSITGGNLINLGTITIIDPFSAVSTFTLDDVQFTNTGTVTIGDGSNADALTLTGTTITGSGSISVETAALLDLTGSDTIQTGALENTGNLNVTGSGNAIANELSAGFSNSGFITVDAGGQLTLSERHPRQQQWHHHRAAAVATPATVAAPADAVGQHRQQRHHQQLRHAGPDRQRHHPDRRARQYRQPQFTAAATPSPTTQRRL